MAGMKLWVPPPVVKFGCLMHDEQLSSSASRICRMVAVASIQIAFFVAPVPGPRRWLSMVGNALTDAKCARPRGGRAQPQWVAYLWYLASRNKVCFLREHAFPIGTKSSFPAPRGTPPQTNAPHCKVTCRAHSRRGLWAWATQVEAS